MKLLWCWRCRMEVPMLDDDEFREAHRLYREGMYTPSRNMEERFKKLIDYYFEVTGFRENNPNAIIHHGIKLYGPPCENCGKPYRTDKASFCAACGHKRV